MKINTKITTLTALFGLGAYLVATAEDQHGHDHAGHEHHDHNHAGHEHHDAGIVAGPNDGRVFTGISPELEFVVLEDRSIQIHQLDANHAVVPIGQQKISAIAGDRSSPTILGFNRQGDFLVSNNKLPAGNDFPIVVSVGNADGSLTRIKFNLNLAPCPSCDNLEYACECDHDHAGHDHD